MSTSTQPIILERHVIEQPMESTMTIDYYDAIVWHPFTKMPIQRFSFDDTKGHIYHAVIDITGQHELQMTLESGEYNNDTLNENKTTTTLQTQRGSLFQLSMSTFEYPPEYNRTNLPESAMLGGTLEGFNGLAQAKTMDDFSTQLNSFQKLNK